MAGEHEGHRKRIIKKLESGTLLDHELIEILLFSMVPRRNTNDIAHRLLKRFGTVQEIFSASMEELMQVQGVGESVAANIRCVGIVYRKHFLVKKEGYEGRYEPKNFVSFVNEQYENTACEVFDVYLIGKGSEIVRRKRYTEEDGFSAKVNVAELSKLLANERPSGIVVVHNHPQGDFEPSKADDETTYRCQLVCSMHGIVLCDHCIYSPQGVYSYYLSGRMREISRTYSFSQIGEKKGEGE